VRGLYSLMLRFGLTGLSWFNDPDFGLDLIYEVELTH
jgi:hypothetical protein